MSTSTPSRSSFGTRAIAALVLLVAAWFLFHLVLHVVVAVATVLAVIVAVIAVIWAIRVL
jgi:hypothetical protein